MESELSAPINPVTGKPSTGAVLYRGPSMLDGRPVIVVAILASRNRKTGSMVQTYIMRSDIAPLDASKTGADFSICGDCKHRGTPSGSNAVKQASGRSCYVNLGRGPTAVYKGLQRGIYPDVTAPEAVNALGADRNIRLGTYGDPLAVPVGIWRQLLRYSNSHTGYTHQSARAVTLSATDLVMLSADNASQAMEFKKTGLRYFRGKSAQEPVLSGEIHCPASRERGAILQCSDCKACEGTGKQGRLKSVGVVINWH